MTQPRAITSAGMAGYVDDWTMSPGLMVDDFLCLKGVTGAGPASSIDPDPQVQIRSAFQWVEAVLHEVGIVESRVGERTT